MKKALKYSFIAVFFCLLFKFNLLAQDGPIKWQEYKSTHFIIYYKNAPDNFIVKLSEKAEDYYNKIAEDLGFMRYDFWLWENRAQIYIYDTTEEYQAATGMPGWSLGGVRPQEKIINAFMHEEGFLQVILPHELGHIIFREFVGFNNYAIPLWLDEGVASYQEKAKHPLIKTTINKAIQDGTFMNIDALAAFKPMDSVDRKAIDLFYIESISIVNYLIKEFGKDNFVTFCQALRDKKDLNRALASAFPFSNTKELQEYWQAYLKK